MGHRKPGIAAANIRRLMDDQGIGPTELERRSGVPRSTINSLLRGEAREPHPDTIRRLARGFGVDETEILLESLSESEIEELVAQFRMSPLAQLLEPPFGEADAAYLRGPGRRAFTGKRPGFRVLYRLTLVGRDLASESDDESGG